MKLRATYFYGSVPKAIAAIKKPGGVLHEWDKQKVITALRRLHRSKDQLRYIAMRDANIQLCLARPSRISEVGVGRCLRLESIPTDISFTTNGASRNEWDEPRSGATGKHGKVLRSILPAL